LEIFFLILFVILPALAYWRSRSIAWTVLALATSVSLVGIGVNLLIEWGYSWSRLTLQIALLVALIAVVFGAFLSSEIKRPPVRRQLLAILLPTFLLVVFFVLVWVFMVPGGGFSTPVGYLMGHPGAEDNAKWLDFAAGYAASGPIEQLIPTGGPLQLVFTFIGTAMGVLSAITLGGYNEVFVAANTVVVTEYFLAVMAPLAVAPLVNARFKVRAGGKGVRIPIPFIWLSGGILVSANLLAVNYGHVTFEYVTAALVLVAVTFLVGESRGNMWMALIVMGSLSTIWWPLNILSFASLAVLLIGVILVFRSRGGGTYPNVSKRSNVLWSLSFLGAIFAIVGTWQPLTSSLRYVFESAGQAAVSGLALLGGIGEGISASAAVPTGAAPVSLLSALGIPTIGIAESSLFAAAGGTERVGPILAILAALALVGSGALVARDRALRASQTFGGRSGAEGSFAWEGSAWIRYLPLIGIVGYAIAINALDLWSTGEGPNYGAQKMAFLAVIVLLVSTLSLGLLFINSNNLFGTKGTMSIVGWVSVGAIVYLLIIDSIVPRSIAVLRPQQWTPSFAYVANANSNWYPAEVNGSSEQSIAQNPVACVYLPPGAPAPTALVEPPDSQRPYACTRILAGLSGMDSEAQSLVDWLRREWTTNTPAWTDEYDRINSMPDSVKSKTVILMDSTSNVIGLETVQGLLNRYTVERVNATRGIG